MTIIQTLRLKQIHNGISVLTTNSGQRISPHKLDGFMDGFLVENLVANVRHFIPAGNVTLAILDQEKRDHATEIEPPAQQAKQKAKKGDSVPDDKK